MHHRKYEGRPDLLDMDIALVARRIKVAMERSKPLNGPHEGYAYIKEAMDKMWRTITADSYTVIEPYHTGILLSAAAVRYVVDLAPLTDDWKNRPVEDRINNVLIDVASEVKKAMTKHAPMVSKHEAYGVIREEVDELWDEVKPDRGRSLDATKEAIQIAAMGIRYILDVTGVWK